MSKTKHELPLPMLDTGSSTAIQGNCLFLNSAEIIRSLSIKASNYDSQNLLINTLHILRVGQSASVQVPLSMGVG